MSKKNRQRRRASQSRLSGGAKGLMALIVVLGVGAATGIIVWRVVSPSPPNANAELTAAEVRFEQASRSFDNGMRRCGTGATRLRCSEAQDRAWGQAFEQLATSLSSFSFPSSKADQAAALVRDARQIGHALLVASRTTTPLAHFEAFLTAQGLLRQFNQDANLLLGHGL